MTTSDDRSRTERRRAERALLDERKALLDALAGLPPEARAAIPGPPDLRAAIEQIAAMKADSARRRIIRHFARRTPEATWPDLRDALETLKGLPPEAVVTAEDEQAADWAGRLIEDGDAALAGFLDRFRAVDRNHVRRLQRNARNREGSAAARARAALEEAIKEALLAEEGDG